MSTQDSKLELTERRLKLIAKLTPQISVEQRNRIQEELRLVNAKLKSLNTTEAYRLKAEADQRKAAGLAEAAANTARATARMRPWPSSAPGEPGFGDPINVAPIGEDENDDDDPGQTAAVDGWIDAVLLRHDIEFTRGARGLAIVAADIPRNVTAAIELLITGVNAAARGQELPDLPNAAPRAVKATKAAKTKARKRP